MFRWFWLFIAFACSCESMAVYKTGFRMPAPHQRRNEKLYTTLFREVVIPPALDLRAQGYVNPIKNQGNCGSCWAFAATAVLEGMAAKKFGHLISMSEQEIIDCAHGGNAMACEGGNPPAAWAFTHQSAQVKEVSYPYVSGMTGVEGTCTAMAHNLRMISASQDYQIIQSENDLKTALVEFGPVAIGVQASDACFMEYKGGILSPSTCACGGPMDHAVVVVGYNTTVPEPYWIIRNSWGTAWGEQGYGRLAMGVNQCNIMGFATIPNSISKTKFFPSK